MGSEKEISVEKTGPKQFMTDEGAQAYELQISGSFWNYCFSGMYKNGKKNGFIQGKG